MPYHISLKVKLLDTEHNELLISWRNAEWRKNARFNGSLYHYAVALNLICLAVPTFTYCVSDYG